jgi:MFS family permease
MSEAEPTSKQEEPQGELARLRDRTDEIELIISGLTTLALFTLPGWLFEILADRYSHFSVGMIVGSSAGIVLITGLCYGLAACFVLHLLTRAYWVGLIGLRTTFPAGINWNKTSGMGPLTREHHRAHLPDLKTAIERSDRLASSLFAVISMLALSVLWVGVLMLVVLTTAGVVGAQLGMTNRFIFYSTILLGGLLVGLPTLAWLLDAQIGTRFPRLQKKAGFRATVSTLRRLVGLIFPERLILPVQLTLQSNTRPTIFLLAMFLGVVAIVYVGQTRMYAWTNFTLSGEFRYLSSEHVGQGMRSTHYESLRSPKDRLRPWPMIPDFEQQGTHLRLFLPYQPLRDNLVADKLCPPEQGPAGPHCLSQLWAVRLNGHPVELENFLPTERMDLSLRGLTGLVALDDIAPGLQTLEVIWNPLAADEDQPLDDRYASASFGYTIPFLFNPSWELELDEETGRTFPFWGDNTHR